MSLDDTRSTSLEAGTAEEPPLEPTEPNPSQTEIAEMPQLAEGSATESSPSPPESTEIGHLLFADQAKPGLRLC